MKGRNMAGLLGFSPTKQRTCALCGKTFGAGEEYVYKLAKPHTGTAFDWYCGYACFRAAQKPREEARKAHRAEMERRARARAEKTPETKRRREEEKARLKAQRKAAARRPVSRQEKETVAQMIARMRRASEERRKER